jgi:hypothetical protein
MATKFSLTLTTQPEEESPEQSERRTGSAPGYAKAVREVMETAEGRWGWCTVKIAVKANGKEGTAYLGNCSYKNAEDFVKTSDYFQQMVEEALTEAISG